MDLNIEFRFSAAHHLPNYDGPCKRNHGHNYRFEIEVRGEPDAHSGMILDFVEIDRIVTEKIIDVVDHQDLNDFLENPTAELIAKWFWELLAPELSGLRRIRLWEIDNCSVIYRGPTRP